MGLGVLSLKIPNIRIQFATPGPQMLLFILNLAEDAIAAWSMNQSISFGPSIASISTGQAPEPVPELNKDPQHANDRPNDLKDRLDHFEDQRVT